MQLGSRGIAPVRHRLATRARFPILCSAAWSRRTRRRWGVAFGGRGGGNGPILFLSVLIEWEGGEGAALARISPRERRDPSAAQGARRYNDFMITRGIRELVARDWEAARENKEIYWGERIGRLGATEGLRVADELRRQMLRRDPGWPDAATRQADLRFHASLAERFRRADATRRR